MCNLSLLVLSAGLVIGLTSPAHAQDDARAVLTKAIEAQGGEAKLSKVRAGRAKIKGTLYDGNQQVPFTGQESFQLPSQIRIVLMLKTTPKAHSIVQVTDGDKGWISVDGQAKEADTAALARMRQQLYLSRVLWLTPLLKDKEFTLTALKEIKVDDKPAAGVKVAAKGQMDISLYFDKASGLLVKVEYLTKNNLGREVTQEEYFSDYTTVAGIKRPKKGLAFQDGKKLMDVEITESQFPESIPASEFGKP